MSIEQEYRRVRKNLRERIRYWEKTKGIRYPLPLKPETITQESISELESIRFKNITDIADLQTQYVQTHDVRAHQLSEFNYSGPAVYEWGLQHRSEVAASPSLVEQFPVLESYDMTLEATVTKMMWAMAQTNDADEFKKLFYQTINHDILFV